MTRAERHKAIVKRRIFIAVCVCILAALILLIAFVIKSAFGGKKKGAAAQRAKSYPMYRAKTQRRVTLQQGLTAWTQTMSSFYL